MDDLIHKFQLPQWMRFRYLQLRHVARAQFPQLPLLQADPIEDLVSPGDLDNTLWTLYIALLGTDSPKMEGLWKVWQSDLPSLDRED